MWRVQVENLTETNLEAITVKILKIYEDVFQNLSSTFTEYHIDLEDLKILTFIPLKKNRPSFVNLIMKPLQLMICQLFKVHYSSYDNLRGILKDVQDLEIIISSPIRDKARNLRDKAK